MICAHTVACNARISRRNRSSTTVCTRANGQGSILRTQRPRAQLGRTGACTGAGTGADTGCGANPPHCCCCCCCCCGCGCGCCGKKADVNATRHDRSRGGKEAPDLSVSRRGLVRRLRAAQQNHPNRRASPLSLRLAAIATRPTLLSQPEPQHEAAPGSRRRRWLCHGLAVPRNKFLLLILAAHEAFNFPRVSLLRMLAAEIALPVSGTMAWRTSFLARTSIGRSDSEDTCKPYDLL